MISVVIPTYNRGADIAPTVQSVLNQDVREPVELLIVDDGSTDSTWEFLQSTYGEYPQIRLFHTPNGGVARARNFGLEQARGEFIAYLDHDDLWLPHKLRLQSEILHQKPEIGVVYCLWSDADEGGQAVESLGILNHDERSNPPQGQVFERLLHNNFIMSMTLPLMRTSLLRDVGGFDASMVPCDDWDLWIRLSKRCQFGVVSEISAIYCHHAAQQSSDESRMLRATQRVLGKHILKYWPVALKHPKIVWVLWSMPYFLLTRSPHYNDARAAISQSNWPGAKRALRSSFSRFPWLFLTPQWLYVLKRIVTRNARPF